MKKGEVLSIVAQKRIIERLDRIEQNFDRIFDNLGNLAENVDDLKGGILRHDQTLYEFVVKPVRDEEDKNEQLGKMIYSGQFFEKDKDGR